jgi:hypothetical protein
MKIGWALLLCAANLAVQTEFDRYVQSAEARMKSRKAAVQQTRSAKTSAANGSNPHTISGGMIHDWSGSIFLPGVKLDRLLRMLRDYDHRARYFPEILSSAKLLCRSGDHFRVAMRIHERATIDIENDVLWERIDERHWTSRSYSAKVQEVGGDHKYLLRLNSYWWFTEADGGVYVEAETITLSGQFSAATRALGSLFGISPEKSLKRTLETIRDVMAKPGLQFAEPNGVACGSLP